jgi:uncharacterized protein YdhG (YjbR/CyaY superfamily)
MSPKKKSKKKATKKTGKGFTAEERAAMKERAQELKAEARWKKGKAEGEKDLLSKIAELKGSDRAMGTKLHAIVQATAPELAPRTWYGMPAYANKDGKVVCYFTPASKFKSRYATFGFNDDARLDDGKMWPTSFALKEIGAAEEKRITTLVEKAVSGS